MMDALFIEWVAFASALPMFAWVSWDAGRALWRKRKAHRPFSLLVFAGAHYVLTFVYCLLILAAVLRWANDGMIDVNVARGIRISLNSGIIIVELGFMQIIRGKE